MIGGGVAGLAFACAAKELGHRILVAERRAFSTSAGDVYDLRVNSIHLGSEAFLRGLGAWHDGDGFRCCPFRRIEVWGESGGEIVFGSDEIGRTHLGHIVENSVLTAALACIAHDAASIELREHAQIQSLRQRCGAMQIGFASGETVNAGLVVGADGGNSSVRALAGIAVQERSYGQTAIVAQIKTSLPHMNASFQRFLSTGPLAFLPLKDGSSSIVWSCGRQQAAALLALSDEQFGHVLAEQFEHRLGETELISKRVSFALNRVKAASYIAERVVLIGDSAHVIHPLAGMGANLGLMDAAALAEVVDSRCSGDQPIWSHRAYREYERWRKTANAPIMHAMDGFDAGFRNAQPALRKVLGFGLSATNRFAPIKRQMMLLACGISGDQPAATRRNDR